MELAPLYKKMQTLGFGEPVLRSNTELVLTNLGSGKAQRLTLDDLYGARVYTIHQ